MKSAPKLWGALLTLTTVSHSLQFTEDDFREIKNKDFHPTHYHAPGETYKKVFKEEFKFDSSGIRTFRLDRGVDVKINFTAYQQIKNHNFKSTLLQDIILDQDFKDYQIQKDSDEVISLRKVYGSSCKARLIRKKDWDSIRMGLLFPQNLKEKPLISEDQLFEFIPTNTKPLGESLDYKTALAEDSSRIIIRYLSPLADDENRDKNYVVFIKNNYVFDLSYGSEMLIAELKAQPISDIY